MSKMWRSAVVGTGVVGEWHVRTVAALPNSQLAAVCDVDAARSRTVLEKHGLGHLPAYTDLHAMLRKEKLDVVHICTPSGAHMGPAIAAMEAGANVVMEKPLEIRLDRIDKMIDVATQRGVRLAGIFQNRWNDANRAIKAAMEEGRFGRLAWAGCFTPWYRPDKYYDEGGWRGTWKLDGGGAIMNQSVHAIDLLQWVVGPVKSVSAYGASRIHARIEVEDTLSCSLQFENGAFGTIVGTTAMYPGSPARLELGGENGTAVSENGLKVFKFRDERPSDKEALEGSAAKKPATTGGGSSNTDVALDLHGRNMHAILTAWEEGRDAETSGPEARKAVAIILAMYESVRNNGAGVDVE